MSQHKIKVSRGNDMKKCEECLHSILIISENGCHFVCCLSQKKAMDCIMGKKSQFATLKRDEDGNIKVERNEVELHE